MEASEVLRECRDLTWWRVDFDTSSRVVVTLESSLGIKAICKLYPKMKHLTAIKNIDYSNPIDSYLVQKSVTEPMGLGFAETGKVYKPSHLGSFYEDYLIVKLSQLPQ